jgi:hypothetical protein
MDNLSNAEVFQLVKEKFGVEVKDKDDIAAAWAVVEKINLQYGVTITLFADSVEVVLQDFIDGSGLVNIVEVEEETAPLAICKAALAAVESER